VVAQLIATISGIIVIRLLPSNEYAFYTIANTMLGAMTIIADGGIASGVWAEGGRFWKDKYKLGAIISTGMELRKKFATLSFLFLAPAIFFLLQKHGASVLTSTLLVLSILPSFINSLSIGLLVVAPSLNQDVSPLQRKKIESNILRLAFTCLLLFIFPVAFVAITASGIAQMVYNFRLRPICYKYAQRKMESDQATRKKIIDVVKRSMPMAVYSIFADQINVWLLSLFSSTEAVAQIGALTRLAMFLSILKAVFYTLATPRFSRLPNIKRLLISRFLVTEAALILISVAVVTAVAVLQNQLLWILGNQYSDLNEELILMATVSCLVFCNSILHSMNSARAYIFNPWILIPLTTVILVVSYLIFPPYNVRNALLASLIACCAGPIIQNFNFALHIRSASKQ